MQVSVVLDHNQLVNLHDSPVPLVIQKQGVIAVPTEAVISLYSPRGDWYSGGAIDVAIGVGTVVLRFGDIGDQFFKARYAGRPYGNGNALDVQERGLGLRLMNNGAPLLLQTADPGANGQGNELRVTVWYEEAQA